MSIFLVTFFNLLMLFALTIPGMVMGKFKLFSDNAVKDLSNMLLYIGMPFLIFSNMSGLELANVNWLYIVISVAVAIFIHIIGVCIVYLVCRGNDDLARKRVCAFSAGFANCGFLGIPITISVAPDEIMSEVLLYVTLYNVVFSFLSWIVGQIVFKSEDTEQKSSLVNAFLNPCAIGFYISVILLIIGINVMELDYFGDYVGYLSGLCAPISMIVLGLRLPKIDLKKMIKTAKIYVSLIVRLIVSPLIALGIMLLLRVTIDISDALILAIGIMSSMPAAATVIAFAEKYNTDSLLASEIVVVSTFLSVITVPLMVSLSSMIMLI